MRVLICGDTHGQFFDLARFFEAKLDLVLQCGDFGYWPRHEALSKRLHALRPPFPIHWCDGNHEDHHALDNLRWGGKYGTPRPEGWNKPPQAYKVAPGVFWQERGSTLTLPDGRTVLFAGGAFSVDWWCRTDGVSWFKEEEVLTDQDFARFPDCKVDIVVSHTTPLAFGPMVPGEKSDPTRAVLDRVFERYRPSLWFFAHWHVRKFGQHEGCEWHGLGSLDTTGPLKDGYFLLEG